MTPDHQFTQLALIRHARTVWNDERRIQGWQDSPLTEQGLEQADTLGRNLREVGFKGILCSDLGRARKTADTINMHLRLPVVEDRRLRERNFGTLEGCPISDKLNGIPPDAESPQAMRQRVVAALQDTQKYGPFRLLVITHHGVLHYTLPHLAGPAYPLHKGKLLKSNRMHWVGVCRNRLGVMRLNDKI